MSNPDQRKQPTQLGSSRAHVDPLWPNALHDTHPELSAAAAIVPWQKRALIVLALAVTCGLSFGSDATATVLMVVLTPAFLCGAMLRAAALHHALKPAAPIVTFPSNDTVLPVYSILVPLYREAHMAVPLVAALDRLDWPVARREILFITEHDDAATRLAFELETRARPGMWVITVPPGSPRTKPRALMYALPLTTGSYVVVYDAEDEPEPGQLREALRRFSSAGSELGCLQARLNIYNARKSWITRQFALEYTALFDAVLPTIQRLGLPVPLGGTSNHFRRAALEKSGGWDPYNVTEDADLGIRLARMGWRVEMLASTTWEEAPPTTRIWRGQRTRWLKGWMQTSLVHLRDPVRLLSDLGLRGFIGFNVLMGSVILSALVHPLVYAYAVWKLAAGDLTLWPPNGWAAAVWWFGVANLAFAYTAAVALGFLTGWRRHGLRLAIHAFLVPLYWLLISAAAYRAIHDLIRSPFHWRKTAHSGRGARNKLGG